MGATLAKLRTTLALFDLQPAHTSDLSPPSDLGHRRGIEVIELAHAKSGGVFGRTGLFGRTAATWRAEGVAPDDVMAVSARTRCPAKGIGAVFDAAGERERHDRAEVNPVLVDQGKLKPGRQVEAA